MHTTYQDRRKHRRYELKYRVHAVFHSGDSVLHLDTVSGNASVSGLQLVMTSSIPELSPVSFIMTLESRSLAHPVELLGEGIVVRVEASPQGGYLVAIECKRPITEIEEHIPHLS